MFRPHKQPQQVHKKTQESVWLITPNRVANLLAMMKDSSRVFIVFMISYVLLPTSLFR